MAFRVGNFSNKSYEGCLQTAGLNMYIMKKSTYNIYQRVFVLPFMVGGFSRAKFLQLSPFHGPYVDKSIRT